MSLISARQLSKAYGPQTLFSDLSLTVSEGDRVGLLGMNGAGKSTLLRVLAGLVPPDGGTLERRRGARILYLAQEPVLAEDRTPRQLVEEGLKEWHEARAAYDAISLRLARGETQESLVEEQARWAETIEHLGGWERGHVVEEMLTHLKVLHPDRPVGSMSGGERRRVALAQMLVAQPDLAIVDEPTNHLDAETIEWLEDYFNDTFPGALLLVTHDRYVLDAVANRIVELENGTLLEYAGNYSDFLEKKAELLEHAERVEANRLNFLRRERAWLMRGAKARTTKQKARIQRAEAAMAVEAPKERDAVRLEGAAVARLGGTILELRDATVTIADRTLFSGLTLPLVAGERIGIVGPNGVGKTSLLKIVSGEWTPAKGEVVRGARTKMAYFDQARAQLEDDWSIYDNVAEREGAERTGGGVVEVGDRTIELRTYLEQFLFEGSKQRQKVGALSGGERARVALAKMLKGGANLYLLDEPTNDLDVATLGALEEMLESFRGCALVVSHDRYFLNRVATSILAFEQGDEGRWQVVRYPGNYDTYRTLKAEAEAARKSQQENLRGASRGPGTEPLAKGSDGRKDARGSASVTAAAPVEASTAPAKPLTFAERKELDTIFDTIGSAEERVAALEARLLDPAVYSKADESRAVQTDLEKAKADLVRLTARWEDLEARKDIKKP